MSLLVTVPYPLFGARNISSPRLETELSGRKSALPMKETDFQRYTIQEGGFCFHKKNQLFRRLFPRLKSLAFHMKGMVEILEGVLGKCGGHFTCGE